MSVNGENGPIAEGHLLQARRRQLRLTQHEVAELAQVSVRALRNIERGQAVHPRAETLRRLSAVLGPHEPANSGLQIDVLGPLQVRRHGLPVEVRAPKLRSLLGLLALHPGEVVPRDVIVDLLWGVRPPKTCLNLVHGYVGRLRELLELRHPPSAGTIVTSAGGYGLHLPADQLDLSQFDALTVAAAAARDRDDLAGAVALWEEALSCWRAAVLADADSRLRQHPAAVSVNQRRLTATLELAEVATMLGCGDRAIEPLRVLTPDEPLHERLHARLMICLANCGQQAAALRLYADVRNRLAEELGIGPGSELANAHLAILRGQAAVADQPAGRDSGAAPLPPDVGLVGRERELAILDRIVGDRVAATTMVITGVGGSGKTALAVHWAHRAADRFPDGCRYVDLHGYSPRSPMSLDTAVDLLLWSLGAPAPPGPADLDRRLALYRSELGRQRILIILDNVPGAADIRPLIATSPRSAVLVVSRDRLESLVVRDAADRIELGMLSVDEAVDMLRRIGGLPAAPATDRQLTRVAQLCGRLPLAIRVVGCRLAANPHDVAGLADRLDRSDDRLAALEIDQVDAGVRAAFDLSYRTLGEDAARLFRLLGAHDGPSIDESAAMALIGPDSTDTVGRLLAELASANLVTKTRPASYVLHDLVRTYARQQCDRLDPPERREAAIRRLVDWYLDRTYTAYRLLSPRASARPPEMIHPPVDRLELADRHEAAAWFQAERANVATLVRTCLANGWSRSAWQLAYSMFAFNQSHRRWSDWIPLCDEVLEAVQATGDALGECRMLNVLAVAHKQRGDFAAARDQYHQALRAADAAGEPLAAAAIHVNLGGLYNVQEQYDLAETHLRAALGTAGYGDDPRYGQLLWLNLSHLMFNTGRFEEAADGLRRGLALTETTGDEHTAAYLYHGLGEVSFQLGRMDEAAEHARQALRRATATQDPLRRAYALDLLGSATMHSAPAEAEASWHEAIAICEELAHPLAEEARYWLEHERPSSASELYAAERERRYRVNRLP